MNRTQTLTVAVLLTALTAACEGYGSSDRQQATAAQQEADRAATEAHNEAVQNTVDIDKKVAEKTTETRKDYEQAVAEGVTKTAEAHTDANAQAANAQALANDKIRAAKANIMAADVELRAWAQKRLDALDHDIDGAKVKAQTAKPAKLDDFKLGITEVEAKRNTLASDIGSVSAGDAAAAAKVKDGIDKRFDSLQARVDVLSKKL